MSLHSIEDHQSSFTRSLQVINSINCVIRELVENSIDALSTQIEIKLHNGGVDLIQVSDNGSGISESDFELLASKHTTSKIKKFEDLFSSLTTFGFRGEALYSLCNLSSLEVETRVESSDNGWQLKYDSFGNLLSKNPVATNVGTCVRVKGLFKDYPVRQKLLVKNSKVQISKAISQIQQYALINPNIGFKFTSVSNNIISTLFSTSGSNKNLRSVVEQIFGYDFSSKLIDFYLAEDRWRIEGLISSPYIEGGSADLEYFYINKRPIGKTTKFKNSIASVFSHFSSRPRPSYILNLTIDYESVDINLSPDKRSAFLLSEDYIIREFRNKLYEILTPKNFSSSQINSHILTQYLSQSDLGYSNTIVEISPLPPPEVKSESDEHESRQIRQLEVNECENSPKRLAIVDATATTDDAVNNEMLSYTSQDISISPWHTLKDFLDNTEEDDTEDVESALLEIKEDSLYRDDKPFIPYEDSQQVMEQCEINKDGLQEHDFLDPRVFRNMEVVGQFNNSFIITKLNFPGVNSDYNYSIYIIDQHAADEKAKFETLNKSVNINKQRLINPKLIELSPFLTQVAEQHLDLLLLNGFDTTISKETELVMFNDPEIKMSAGSQDHMAKGVYVHTFPQVLGRELKENDLIEFIHQLSSTEGGENVNTNQYIRGTGSIPRPQKVWNLLATRACKSSIKVGDSLSNVQMKSIIKNLSLLIHPWNCPHGRPSIKPIAQKKDDMSQQATSDEYKCESLKILDVSSVYSIGNEAFVTCSDVKINLYKIYVYLTEAISRLKSMENSDADENCRECLSSLNFLLRRFNGYIRICMKLSEELKYVSLKRSKSENTYVPIVQQFNKFREITSKFKVDQLELNRLFETDFDESASKGSSHYSSERLTLLWSFYRDADCSDVFALLCYTLFTANPLAYKALLENYERCIKSHLKRNWKVLLSYIPISFEFKEYQYVFESVLFDDCDGQSGVDLSYADENLMLCFIDWCLWRIYLIVKYTNSSYFLFIRFIKNMSKLLANIDKTPRMDSKLQLLNFLKFIIKQYFIYKSLNSNVSYSDNLNIGVKEVAGGESGERMSFFEYLDLKASKKLSLFCEFEVSQSNQECECDEQYKDKHKVYKFCLHCKTSNLSNKLKSFFVLISPATESLNTTRTINTPNSTMSLSPMILTSSARIVSPDMMTNMASRSNITRGVNVDQHVYGNSDTNRDELENEYVLLNEDFGDFYSSLLSSYNSGLNDYLSGISESFMKQLNTRSFEILYSLSTVLLETGFRNKLFSIFVQIVYSGSCEYNFLENYFLIKSTFNLITSHPGFNRLEDAFDTRDTLFRLLRHFCLSKDVCNSAYSGYKKLVANLARSIEHPVDITGNVRGSFSSSTDYSSKYDSVTMNTNGGDTMNSVSSADDGELVLSVETLVSCINCQLDFVEVLLNILSLINAEGSSVLMVTSLDLMLSLVSEEHFLVLLQKILAFIIDLALDPLEFSNCMFELINLSNYISSADLDTIHSMFFYTIASKSNLNYLNQQLQLWHSNAEVLKGVGNREGRFLNNSLNCVLNVVYRMDLSCNINMFHLLLNHCKFVPVNSKFYSTQCYFEAMTICSVIDLYVNYVNSNTNIREYLSREGNEEGKGSSDKLNTLEVLSKVYKSILLFECYNLVGRKKHQSLDYKFYDSTSLIDRAFGTLLSLLNEPSKESDGVDLGQLSKVDGQVKEACESDLVKTEGNNYVIQVEVENQVVNMACQGQLRTAAGDNQRGNEVLLLVFKCILEHILANKMYTKKLFDDLKVAIGQLCPRDMSSTLLNLVNILSDITEGSNFNEKHYLELEGSKTALTGLCVNLLVILYLGISNLLVVSNMIQLCVSAHLTKSMTFIYNHLMKTGVASENDESEDENMDFMDDLYFQLHSDVGQRQVDGEVADATSYLEHEASRYVQEHMTNFEINELFDYSNVRELPQEEVYDDAYFRKSVLTMLDVNRSEKTGMRESIGKLANKLGTNVASGFITAAIEKAEGEFLNIAKKTNKLDILKDRLFQQKKQSGAAKSMYPPIMNYFDGSVLHHVNLYDQEGENELLQYRNLGEITVSRLVRVDVETACQMLTERCSYVCNREFLRQMQAVFNENELRHAWKFLDKLEPYLVHTGWPEVVVDKISKVKSFLGLFKDFPENVTISAPSFIYSREYRLNLFKSIPSHVAVNLELVQEIYKQLALFYTREAFDRHRLKPEVEASIDNIQDYLFGPLHTDVLRGGPGDVDKGLGDDAVQGVLASLKSDGHFDEMDEYVEVLFSVYTEIFFEDFNIQSFLKLEPLFLLNQEKYLCFLQTLYHNLTSANTLGTPSSQTSHGLKNFASYSSISSLSSGSDWVGNLEVNNSRLIMVRRCICNFLAVYPELKRSFGTLYRADSSDVVKFLETVVRYAPEFDLSAVDNFELFKQRLIAVLTFDNFFFIADSVQALDPAFAAAIYGRLERGLRPHSDELVDCTRLLFEYDLSNTTI
ncbi:DNA mismatch repair protein [Theileria orientalis]|uniref:DNA mismatch repair protein n=1 Tax=Theileria orientalis TaxID=68886 RepID=A0A976M5K7_THEOR|nr:DNA mismatch repair protein [Theileria orientalis]